MIRNSPYEIRLRFVANFVTSRESMTPHLSDPTKSSCCNTVIFQSIVKLIIDAAGATRPNLQSLPIEGGIGCKTSGAWLEVIENYIRFLCTVDGPRYIWRDVESDSRLIEIHWRSYTSVTSVGGVRGPGNMPYSSTLASSKNFTGEASLLLCIHKRRSTSRQQRDPRWVTTMFGAQSTSKRKKPIILAFGSYPLCQYSLENLLRPLASSMTRPG